MHGEQVTYVRDFVPTYSGSVFHYTSAAGLLGIVESGTIRASAASSLNDLAELRLGWELCLRVLSDLPDSSSTEMLRNWARDPLMRRHRVFVLSASEVGDDANQWRLYGDGGRGYVLELDAAVQLEAFSPVPDASTTTGVFARAKDIADVSPWRRVTYDESVAVAAIQALAEAVESEDHTIASMADASDEARQAAYESLSEAAYVDLATVAHLIKAPGFSGEREVRVVTTFVWGDEHVRYRPSPIGIVAYATLATSPSGDGGRVQRPTTQGAKPAESLPIQSLRMGPLLRPDEHEATVKSFLRINGHPDAAVLHSDVKLRW